MSDLLFFSVGLIFVFALIGSYLRHRRLDRVLQTLVGFHVTLQIQPRRVWGKFKLYPNAIELVFSQAYVNHRGSHLTSYIQFKERMGVVDAIYRFHDELTPANQERRLKQIDQARAPSWTRRTKRSFRNFTVAFKEAISESMGLMASRIQQHTTLAMLKGADSKMKDMGDNLLDITGNAAYDPVLEHYIFHRVVFENTPAEGGKLEYEGILEEYSADWVSILDCHLNKEDEITLVDASRLMMQRKMDFEVMLEQVDDGVKLALKITNRDAQGITLKEIQGPDEFRYNINSLLGAGEKLDVLIKKLPAASLSMVDVSRLPISLQLIAPERQLNYSDSTSDTAPGSYPVLPELSLTFQTCRGVDVYLPRNKGLLRHASECLDPI